jgi:hypothetical protein
MKLIELTLEEKRELEGGWVKEIVSFIAAAIVDAIDNPDDFKKGFEAGRIRK